MIRHKTTLVRIEISKNENKKINMGIPNKTFKYESFIT